MFALASLKPALGAIYFLLSGIPQLIIGGVMVDSPQEMVSSLQEQTTASGNTAQAASTSRKRAQSPSIKQATAINTKQANRIANYITQEFGHSITAAGVLSIVGAAASITGENYGYAAAIALVQAYIHANQALCHYNDMKGACPLFRPEQNQEEVRKLITITLFGLATAVTYAIYDPMPCITAAVALMASYPIKKLVNINPRPILRSILGLVQQQEPAQAQ